MPGFSSGPVGGAAPQSNTHRVGFGPSRATTASSDSARPIDVKPNETYAARAEQCSTVGAGRGVTRYSNATMRPSPMSKLFESVEIAVFWLLMGGSAAGQV